MTLCALMTSFRSRARLLARRLGYEVHRIPEVPEVQEPDRSAPPAPPNPLSAGGAFQRLLSEATPRAVIDVGANVGQFPRWLRETGFTGPVVSFEPQPDEHARLEQAAADDPDWLVAPRTAVGDATGVTQIHIAGNSLSSSLLEMLETHSINAPGSEYVGAVETPVGRLDDLLDELGFNPAGALLKIDTQGFEQRVLAGAPRTLKVVSAVHLEFSLAPLYGDQAKTSELFATLGAAGLELTNINEVFNSLDGRILQLDGSFVRV